MHTPLVGNASNLPTTYWGNKQILEVFTQTLFFEENLRNYCCQDQFQTPIRF